MAAALLKSLTKRGIEFELSSKTTKIERTKSGVKLDVETPKGAKTVEADVLLVAIGYGAWQKVQESGGFQMGGTGGGTMGGGMPPPSTPPPSTPPPSTPPPSEPPGGLKV